MDKRLSQILDFAKANIPMYKLRAPHEHRCLTNWPLISKSDLERFSPDFRRESKTSTADDIGYIVASGGSTARPVYIQYSHREVDSIIDNLVFHFTANGLAKGDRVVNYFGAGDMCGAFSMVDKALVHLPVTILPLGFTPNLDFALEVIDRLRPNVIIGIPTLLVNLAHHCEKQGLRIGIEKVLYGGELMAQSAAAYLSEIWRCTQIRSAGYASTEVGAIGWQCRHCGSGEHFPFSDNIVEILEDEIVVTSLARTVMPLVRYRTGDRGEWVEPRCKCGNGSPLFKLLGRINTATVVWGCWLRYEDVCAAFDLTEIPYIAIQLEIYSRGCDQFVTLKFETEQPPPTQIDRDKVIAKIYENNRDLNQTVTKDFIEPLVNIEAVAVGGLKVNARTGKTIPIVDLRS